MVRSTLKGDVARPTPGTEKVKFFFCPGHRNIEEAAAFRDISILPWEKAFGKTYDHNDVSLQPFRTWQIEDIDWRIGSTSPTRQTIFAPLSNGADKPTCVLSRRNKQTTGAKKGRQTLPFGSALDKKSLRVL